MDAKAQDALNSALKEFVNVVAHPCYRKPKTIDLGDGLEMTSYPTLCDCHGEDDLECECRRMYFEKTGRHCGRVVAEMILSLFENEK
jgi:hypothetical protein